MRAFTNTYSAKQELDVGYAGFVGRHIFNALKKTAYALPKLQSQREALPAAKRARAKDGVAPHDEAAPGEAGESKAHFKRGESPQRRNHDSTYKDGSS